MNKFIQVPERRIFRAEHGRSCPYVKTAKKAVDDTTLSLAARGLLTVLLSKPDHWKIEPEQIAREQHIGIQQARKLLNELVAAEYLIPPARRRNPETGQFEYTGYYLRELPGLTVAVSRIPSHGGPPAAGHATAENEKQVQNGGIKESTSRTDLAMTDKQHQTDSIDDASEIDAQTGEDSLDGDEVPASQEDGRDQDPVPPPPVPPTPSPVSRLAAAGVDAPLRETLGALHLPEDIERAIAYTHDNATENPAGFLVKCLTFGWHRDKQRVFIDPRTKERYFPGQYDAYLNS